MAYCLTFARSGRSESNKLSLSKLTLQQSETYTPFANPMEAEEYSINYNSAVHGFDGPVQVSYPKYLYPQSSE